MKKAGLMAASLATAALLAVGAGSIVTLLNDPAHVVEEANASEVKGAAPAQRTDVTARAAATQAGVTQRAARLSDAQQIEVAAQRSGSVASVPSDRTTEAPQKEIKDFPRRARVVRGDDDDDDWGDD